MIAEIGHFFLIISFVLAFLQLILSAKYSFFALRADNFIFLKRITYLIGLSLFSSFIFLIISYVTSDFSVLNVYNNSHSNKPLIYKISGTWGNHEGSLLMWLTILGIYGFFFTLTLSFIDITLSEKITSAPIDAFFESLYKKILFLLSFI